MSRLAQQLVALGIVVACAACSAHAQHYPAKTIEIVVSYAAGGSTDLIARAIALVGDGRSVALPGVPTFKEAGVADFDLDSWNVLLAPKGTPAGIIRLLKQEIAMALNDSQVRATLGSQGVEPSQTQDV